MTGPAPYCHSAAILLCGLLPMGCQLTPLGDGLPAEEDCVSCHRAADGEGKPLFDDPSGDESHAVHEEAGYDCEACHPVPEAVADDGHAEGTVDVTFGELARSGGAAPRWDPEEKTCAGVYCHGGAFEGGSEIDPVWVGEMGSLGCEGCHKKEPETGAHTIHLEWGLLCVDCHPLPSQVTDEEHIDGAPAEVALGHLARRNDSTPEWDSGEKRCSGVYCHGSNLEDGVNTEPVWTELSDDEVPCESCHGMPPLNTHFPESTECWYCHTGTVDGNGDIIEEDGLHINGIIDM